MGSIGCGVGFSVYRVFIGFMGFTAFGLGFRVSGLGQFPQALHPRATFPIALHSWKLTWKPKKGPLKTTVPLKGEHMGFHVSLGECNS